MHLLILLTGLVSYAMVRTVEGVWFYVCFLIVNIVDIVCCGVVRQVSPSPSRVSAFWLF